MGKKTDPELFTPAPLPVAPLDDAGRLACLRLIRSINVGPVRFRKLINHYGGAENALQALPDIAAQRPTGRPIKICPLSRAEAELEAAEKIGAKPLFTVEPGYPALLAMTDAPPPMLYVKGDPARLNQPCVAIVGSRNASAAGVKLTRSFAKALSQAGLCVVSGLARGIDAAAHQAALQHATIGVVAGGLDIVYPPEHKELTEKIASEGAVISEMPPGFTPRGADFPRRNRIIAGISLGVLVVEAAQKSGSLVTARLANEIGREVFAVPGHPLDPRARGTLHLLKEGATLATSPDDILEALQPITKGTPDGLSEPADVTDFQAPQTPDTAPPDENDTEKVLASLSPNPIDIDEIARTTGLSIRTVRSVLFELDLSGAVEHHGQQLVALRNIPDDA